MCVCTCIKDRKGEAWINIKKVGSFIGDEEDITRRKQLVTVTLNKLQSVWSRHDKVKLETRMEMYRALVKSVLLYN